MSLFLLVYSQEVISAVDESH